MSSRSLSLHWSPLPIKDQNGPLTHYLVEYCQDNDLPPSDKLTWHLSEPWAHPQTPCNITVVKVSSGVPQDLAIADSHDAQDSTNLQDLLNELDVKSLVDSQDTVDASMTTDQMDTADIIDADDDPDLTYATGPLDAATDSRDATDSINARFPDPKDSVDGKDTTDPNDSQYPPDDSRDTTHATDLQDLQEVAVHVLLGGLSPSQRYTLRVAAANTAGEGPYSSAVNVTTNSEGELGGVTQSHGKRVYRS